MDNSLCLHDWPLWWHWALCCFQKGKDILMLRSMTSSGRMLHQVAAQLWNFPDRSTAIGQMINAYLASSTELDDATIHLLFSANRWEKRCAYPECGDSCGVDAPLSIILSSSGPQHRRPPCSWCGGCATLLQTVSRIDSPSTTPTGGSCWTRWRQARRWWWIGTRTPGRHSQPPRACPLWTCPGARWARCNPVAGCSIWRPPPPQP